MSMSEREDVLNDHRRRALTGDAKHALLQSSLAVVKKAGRRTGGVQTMDKQRERANNAAVSFFWNYNTVESVLLFCAVLVNLAVSVSCHGCLMSVVHWLLPLHYFDAYGPRLLLFYAGCYVREWTVRHWLVQHAKGLLDVGGT